MKTELDSIFKIKEDPAIKRYHRNMVILIMVASAFIVAMIAFLGVVFVNWLMK